MFVTERRHVRIPLDQRWLAALNFAVIGLGFREKPEIKLLIHLREFGTQIFSHMKVSSL